MRTLAISIGNSTVSGAVFQGARMKGSFRIAHTPSMPAPAFVRELVRRIPPRIDRTALCSVVPARTPVASKAIRRTTGAAPRVLTVRARHGLRIAYRRPAELGTDRLAAALGARVRFPGRDVIIIDFGTATTVTALGRNGVLLGGAILPGAGLWPAMLAGRTARLPAVSLARPPRVIGNSTREAIRSGIFHGHAGAVREIVRLVQAAAFGPAPAIVVATGGNAALFSREKLFTVLEPDLILSGLFAFLTQEPAHD